MGKTINDRGIKRKLTWIPDLPDARDFTYRVTAPIPLPPKVDLRVTYKDILKLPLFDQGTLGSCTANAISTAIDFTRIKELSKPVIPSRLFIYYNERVMENSVKSDAGAMIRDGIKSVANTGYCTEKKWPYIIRKFATKPTTPCYTEAKKNKVTSYVRLNSTSLTELKTSLAQGFGFVFGFTVYESFQSDAVAETGHAPMPNLQTESALGGHAVFAIGYDDAIRCFIVRNSWGTEWGDDGHFYLPYEYVTDPNFADDFWSIRIC